MNNARPRSTEATNVMMNEDQMNDQAIHRRPPDLHHTHRWIRHLEGGGSAVRTRSTLWATTLTADPAWEAGARVDHANGNACFRQVEMVISGDEESPALDQVKINLERASNVLER
jgi:hypothetical protein